MGDGVDVKPDELRSYGQYLKDTSKEFDTIRDYVHSTACDKGGFTGLLAILQPAVDAVGSLFDKTLDFGKSKLNGAGDGIDATAETYENTDKTGKNHMDNVMASLPGAN
jgi:phage-related minor tail protein